MTPPPVVTGLSPIEGPPGTRLTIRGENLGNSPNDVIGLTICGCDCLLSAEWKSPNKIIARSGPGKGRGDVIVSTRGGGLGTSTVQFRGYHETIGPMKESAVWIEEAPLLLIWGRRSLSPSSYQHEDPLGLSVEGNDKKFPEDDLHELFPNASGDIASENFSAEWFLLENHHATSFNDLKAGLSFLRRKVEGQKEGQLSFLKANVGSVMDQIDTLKSLKEKFEDDKQQFGSDPVLKLEKAIKESVHEANKLFDEVLSRRDRADATRSALNVLTRFRFLFCLPCAIDRNVKRGDFDIIINDYSRVKNLFNKTEVPVFRKALNEIEKRVLNLREMLHSKLKQMPISIEEQKRIIRYLVHLEADGEPAWDAISSHSDYITQRLKDCYEEHKTADNILTEELGKSRTFSNSKYSKYNVIQDPQQSVPQVVLFVEEVCDIMSTSFPDLWKLGQAYFSGELQVKVEAGRQAQFKHIVLSLMDTFCKTLRSSLLPLSFDKQADRQKYGIWSPMETDTFASWLPHCLQYVRSTYSIFIRLDLPSEALDIISDLIFELRLNCMIVLLKQANKQMSCLEKKETWKIEFASGHSGITELPLKFEKILHEVIQIISESVLITEQRESPLFDNPEARKNLDTQIDILLTNFRTTLTNLAYHYKNSDEEDHHSPAVSQLIGSSAIYRNSDKLNTIPIWEQRLLTTLSNCHYTSQVILPKIPELFSANGYPVPVTAIDSMKTALQQLDKSILDTYLEQKSDPLVGTIEPSMYLGRFDWDTNLKPIDIKPYAKECINNLIGVHTEVHRVSPVLVEKVLTEVVEIVAEELSRLMSCVKKFSHFGILQARADIQALQETLKGFTTPKAKIFFDEAVDSIPKVQPPDQKLIDNIIKQFRVKMHLQILCFNNNLHSTNGSDQ